MVYIPRVTFKTGIFPSLVRSFPTDGNYTGTQKLLLTSSRIFGTKIGGTMRSGVSPFRKVRMGRQFLTQWRIDLHELHRYWPGMKETEEAQFKRRETIIWREERAKAAARKGKKGK